jgi:hypothetical protein
MQTSESKTAAQAADITFKHISTEFCPFIDYPPPRETIG